jgi:hypothetical protein
VKKNRRDDHAVRKLLCDALDAIWVWVTAPLKTLVADAIDDARDRAAREEIADGVLSLRWTGRDDREFNRYARHCK